MTATVVTPEEADPSRELYQFAICIHPPDPDRGPGPFKPLTFFVQGTREEVREKLLADFDATVSAYEESR